MEQSLQSQLQKAKALAKQDKRKVTTTQELPAWLANNTQYQFGGLVDPVKALLDKMPLLLTASEAVRLRYFQDCVTEITRLLYIVEQAIMANKSINESEQDRQLAELEAQFAEEIHSIQQLLKLS